MQLFMVLNSYIYIIITVKYQESFTVIIITLDKILFINTISVRHNILYIFLHYALLNFLQKL